jgi:hypothetical protein
MKKEDLITTNDAAAFIGCTRRSIENYRRRGWLAPIRLANGRILFVRKQVERLREELLRPPKGYLVKASQDEPEPVWQRSLRVDPDPIIFKPEVWQAVADYQKYKQER